MNMLYRMLLDEPRSRKRWQKGRRQLAGLDSRAPAQTPPERTNECALRAAFATSDFRAICRAVDTEIRGGGITKVAESAKLDRTTLYRAFRCDGGPALDTMTRVLRVLGCRLTVELKLVTSSNGSRLQERVAHSLTTAFASGDLYLVIEALAKALRDQENVAQLARTAGLSRENLYRSFAFPCIPRFRTVLSFLDALGLQLGIERLPSKENNSESQRPAGRHAAPETARSVQKEDPGHGARRKARTSFSFIAGALLGAMLLGSAAQSDELRIEAVSILERGVFQASSGTSIAESNLGLVSNVRNVSLVQSTTTIRARQSVQFGLRYLIAGAPAGAPVEIRLVTRFPAAGLYDPDAGVRHLESEYTVRATIGAPAYRMFSFDRPWEIVHGVWVFEFWHADRNIGSQRFCVLDAETAPHRHLSESECEYVVGEVETEPGLVTGRTWRRS